jgi:hypothetical protein
MSDHTGDDDRVLIDRGWGRSTIEVVQCQGVGGGGGVGQVITGLAMVDCPRETIEDIVEQSGLVGRRIDELPSPADTAIGQP